MSTLPGLASKGEKGKSKYQSLDINNLYRVSLGESVEKQQQKSTLSLKHGMQILGKVPNARRPPANLPSIKSEHSGSDSAVSLVPSNGPGWGKQETTNSTTPVSNTPTTNANISTTPVTTSAHQAAIAIPVTTTVPVQQHKPHPTSVAVPATCDKSWSSVMTGGDSIGHPPPYQSPQFQHEFPSLSAGDGAPVRSATDTQYGPGPSLRPQTEGSWMQGGSRGGLDIAPRNSSAPLGAPPQLSAPVGQPLPPQNQIFVPPFMCKGNANFTTNGHNVPPMSAQQGPPMANQPGRGGHPDPKATDKPSVLDKLAQRPIIREEELSGMDNLTTDLGWALYDDVDYNQTLTFSDDEAKAERHFKKSMMQHQREHDKTENHAQEINDHKTWNDRGPMQMPMRARDDMRMRDDVRSRDDVRIRDDLRIREDLRLRDDGRTRDEVRTRDDLRTRDDVRIRDDGRIRDDVRTRDDGRTREDLRPRDDEETTKTWNDRGVAPMQGSMRSRQDDEEMVARRRHQQQLTDAIERAKQRKEEEEKKFLESKQNAQKKLQKLNERSNKIKRNKENEESIGTINPSAVPPQTIAPVSIPLPEWERDKERGEPRTAGKNEEKSNKQTSDGGQSDFRQLTQIEGRSNFARKESNRVVEKESPAAPSFSKQFQNDLPPRFQRLSAANNSQSFDNRYTQSGNKTSPNTRRTRNEEEKEREDERHRRNEGNNSFRHRPHLDSGRKSSNDGRYDDFKHDYDMKKDRKDEEEKRERHPETYEVTVSRQSSDEWHDRKPERNERPQRPDSRDSRASRDSRDWYISSWPEGQYDMGYEDKKKEQHYRMQVPGPITKEKIEADDLRNEKRNLTQLKKGSIIEKKPEKDKEDDAWSLKRNKEPQESSKIWTDSVQKIVQENQKTIDSEKKSDGNKSNIEEKDKFVEKERDNKRLHGSSRGRSDSQNSKTQGWGGSSVSSKSSWKSNRSGKGGHRKDWPGTESEGSADDIITAEQSEKGLKPTKKIEKDDRDKGKEPKMEKLGHMDKKVDKSREYVPRGEPSRHGRGGSFRNGGRGGCKRIEGYGPPPSKSPFSHPEDKDKESGEPAHDNKNKSNLITKEQMERKSEERNKSRKSDNRRGKPRTEGESDHSDDASKDKRKNLKGITRPSAQSSRRGGGNSAPIRHSDKRNFGPATRNEPPNRQNSNTSLRTNQNKENKEKDINAPTSSMADISLKQKEETENHDGETETVLQSDSDGFQEVKSKKTVKVEKPKVEEKPKSQVAKSEKDLKNDRKSKGAPQLSQQQIASIPSLMATPINPPANLPQSKGQYERTRQNKLPPRLVKQRENNRLHKAQMQQNLCEVNDLNKVNQNVYALKDGNMPPVSISNAWEKPLSTQLRGNLDQENIMSVGIDSCKGLDQTQLQCQNNSTEDKAVLDGSQPLNTIIFENTNFKSAPGCGTRNNNKSRTNKMEDAIDTPAVLTNFNKPIGELLNKNDKEMHIQLPFNKEDTADMKLDFFETEISHLTDDKSTKSIGLPRNIQTIPSSSTTISPSTADALNIKIQSVKKVWETMSTVMEHSSVGQDDTNSFATSFGPDPNALDPTATFNKGADTPDDNHEVYNPLPNGQNASNSTTNVCKVKPTQQVAGSAGQAVLSSGTHQQHSAMVGPGLMGHPLSPPPMQPVIGSGVGLGQPPQQFTTSQHIGYQAGLGSSNQYGGMPAIPSPPAVLYNSTQQLQAQTGLYGPFQIDQSQVLNSHGRSQYSPYSYSLGQTASSPYSQSVYLQTGQPHPPPTAQAPPDLYANMSNYRLPANAPFGQNQQLNNPTTVLISSTSNSLMSATVKASNQPISAIGTKAGGVGQAYQQQSQQGQQLFMAYDQPMQANYLTNTGVLQRPTGPVQNNVVPGLQPSGLQPSSSYYSGSNGGQTGYFQQPGNSTMQSAQMSQHQAGYGGLQGSVFGTHNQSHTSGGMQNYGSHFLSAPIQIAAAMSAQQYRSAMPNAAYMKGVGSQQMTDQSGRSQQLKSPGSQQEVLSSVFNSGSQIPSPKSRQPCKQPPPQPSPTAQPKYLYSGQQLSNQQPGQTRYPAPIQRPPQSYQSLSSVQNNSNQKHRNINSNNNRNTQRQYYGGQGANLNSQNEKSEESKLTENTTNATNSNSGAKTAVSNVNTAAEKNDCKEESSAISKD